MATIARAEPDLAARERRLFLFIALSLVAAAAIGFGYFKLAGKSSFDSPWWVHVHAVSMVGWLSFFVLQNMLFVRGDVALHRRLGLFATAYAVWIVGIGIALPLADVAAHRSRIFTPEGVVALNWMNILTFAGLFTAAFALRHRPDWHKRLMLGAMICLATPAYGRILIMLGARTTLNLTLVVLVYIAIAMAGDVAIRRQVHAAWFWALGAAALMGTMIGALQLFPPFVAFARSFAA